VLRVRLVEQAPQAEGGQDVAVEQPEFLIGRAVGCDLRLPLSAVSRHHCLLRIDGGEASVTDLNSSNGTHVNGERVTGAVRLRPGDRLRVGSTLFVVEMDRPDTLTLDAGV
jgi:pSer/pThr/pTyr-binding forkhead associated (FHA) protein